ncbi:unnamed protein product [Nesidiocoris tenuis]|uniref:Cadherin domain-containing protein n=1 Tax=Nesidiocoris tenuis TaxID=355587 RepID=A0A6H5H9Z8_9HEMI|nr:unnamed protein product [Nesidiocoris tenuis]
MFPEFRFADYGSYVIRIENLPCNKNSSYCEANVFLERTLAPEQVFKFRMTVRDTQGDTTTVPVAIQVTDGVTDFNEVFPHVPGVVMIPEDTAVGTELEYVIVKKHPRAVRQAVLELWIMAKEVSPDQEPLSTIVDVIVYIQDVNDNPPVFIQSNYSAVIAENATAGVPTMFSTGTVRIFPAESGARLMTFVVPGNNLDTQTVHQLLTELTGARVVIHSVERYQGNPSPGQNELIVEDVDGHEYRLLDPSRLSFRRSQADTTSLRRVPSRNSDVHQQQAQQPDLNASHPLPENQADGTMGRPPTRDEEFFRHGNAEVLRLVTRGKENNENGNEDEEPTINQPERPYTHEEGDGKGVIMKKFIEDSNVEANSNELVRASKQGNDELLKRAMAMREKDLTTADINRLTTIQRDILLTRFLVEENRRTRNNSVGDETQSLPGVVTMATQTDSHAETQTDRTYFLKRRAKKPEFTEGAHFLKNGAAFIETKASLLRHAASRTRLSMDDPEEHQTHLELHNSRSMSDQDISSTAGIAGGGPGKRSNTEVPIRSLEATPVRRLNILNNVRTERVTHDELEQSRLPQPISASAPTKKPRVASVPSNKQSIPRPVPTKRLSSSEPIRSRQSSKESIGGQSGHSSLERTEPQSRYMEWYHNNNSRKTETKTDKKEPVERVLPRRRPALRQSRPNQNRNPNTKAPQVVDVDEENIVPNIKETESRRLFIDIDNNDITSNNNNKPELDEDGVKANSRILEVDQDQAARNKSAKGDPSVIFQIVDGPTPGPLRHQKAMEKKSIFTIAYDDMETKKIRLDTASP